MLGLCIKIKQEILWLQFAKKGKYNKKIKRNKKYKRKKEDKQQKRSGRKERKNKQSMIIVRTSQLSQVFIYSTY